MATQMSLLENIRKTRGTGQYPVPGMLDGRVDVPVKEQFMMSVLRDLAPGPILKRLKSVYLTMFTLSDERIVIGTEMQV